VLNHWRDGVAGALRMGLARGFYCLGCCWLLMALLFAIGLVSLTGRGAISALVLAEKLLPARSHADRIVGLLLLGAGIFLIVRVV